jgi:hypothetical protein
METHLTEREARAVGQLSISPAWGIFKEYVERQYGISKKKCETEDKDHRYNQGRAYELSLMAKIEDKALDILNGTN